MGYQIKKMSGRGCRRFQREEKCGIFNGNSEKKRLS